jgi:uncharacterized protein
MIYLRFRYGGSFGFSDPLFNVDIGFYLFRLPFLQLLQSSLTGLTLITLVAALILYAYIGLLQLGGRVVMHDLSAKAIVHLSVLSFAVVAVLGWGFYLDHYELVYSSQGVVYGAGFTAYHVTRIAFWVMIGASAALCILLALNVRRPRLRAIVFGSGLYVATYLTAVWLGHELRLQLSNAWVGERLMNR